MPTLAVYITSISTIASDLVFPLVTDVLKLVATNPVLLLTTGIMVVGAAIGIFGRLLSRG